MFRKNKGEPKLAKPQEIPELVGRYMVTEMHRDPDWVWKLRAVVHPTEKKKAFYCRVFDEAEVSKAGLRVQNWMSLDGHPELVLWEGFFDKDTLQAQPKKIE